MHTLAPFLLPLYSRPFGFASPPQWKSVSWRHLFFPNPLGPAGGVDKNGINTKDWLSLGAGFCEIGTVTPQSQPPLASPILDRNTKYQSLWNCMGFPNHGISACKKQLKSLSFKNKAPLFINIGKNRETPLEEAEKDYQTGLKELHPFADAFVINISSPNTKNLRQLFSENRFPSFLKNLKSTLSQLNPKIPLLLKLSPDETEQSFIRIINQSLEAEVDGWCVNNSTSRRPVQGLFPDHGGLSGKLLAPTSLSLLKTLTQHLDQQKIKDKLIVSCGGVLTPEDVFERLNLGAHLVQVYSALVFEGPSFFKKVYLKQNKL